MTQFAYPLVGYEAQAAAQQCIFERYGEHIHICVIDPNKFKIESEERMQAVVDEYSPMFAEMEFEQNIEDSGIDPDAIHVEVADTRGHELVDAFQALHKLTRDLHLSLGLYPSRDRTTSSGKIVIKDTPRTHRIAFEFGHSLKTKVPATPNPTDFVIQNYLTWAEHIPTPRTS